MWARARLALRRGGSPGMGQPGLFPRRLDLPLGSAVAAPQQPDRRGQDGEPEKQDGAVFLEKQRNREQGVTGVVDAGNEGIAHARAD